MIIMKSIVLFICLFLLCTEITQVQMTYVEIQRSCEFEDAVSEANETFWNWRSEASNRKTLRLVDEGRQYRVDFNVCIEPFEDHAFVILFLDDIRYANDGPNDIIFVTFDGEPWIVQSTWEKWAHGHDWNVFRNTGRLGDAKFLARGEYTIGISVITDKWGIELDKLRLVAEFQNLESKLFCGSKFVDTVTED